MTHLSKPSEDTADILNESIPEAPTLENTIGKFLKVARVESVYGEPIAHGDTLMIPAAEVLGILGFGYGYGHDSETEEEEQEQSGGAGGGGGGRVFARPVAMIVATPNVVRVEPVIDRTKIALAAITAGGFMLAMLLRLISPKHALKQMTER
jgi:uncharacterized spore protein YtfJ